MDFEIMRLTVFLPVGAILLIIGGISIPVECHDDMPSIFKRLIFMMMVVVAISQFSVVMNAIHETMKTYIDMARPDWLNGENINNNKGMKVPAEGNWSTMPLFYLKETLLSFLSGILGCLGNCITMLPNMVRSLSLMMIDMFIAISFCISPLMLSMLTIKKTESAGWSFLLGSIGLAMSTIVFPIIDLIFAQFWGRILVAALASVAPAGISGGFGLAEYLSKIISMVATRSIGGWASIVIVGILAMFIILFGLFAVIGYFIAPFAFAKILTGGGVVSSVSGAFSFMTGQAQQATKMGIEGMEAGARGTDNVKKTNISSAVGAMSALSLMDYASNKGVSMTMPEAKNTLAEFGGDEKSAKRKISYSPNDIRPMSQKG